jgi:hypothetical protein
MIHKIEIQVPVYFSKTRLWSENEEIRKVARQLVSTMPIEDLKKLINFEKSETEDDIIFTAEIHFKR